MQLALIVSDQPQSQHGTCFLPNWSTVSSCNNVPLGAFWSRVSLNFSSAVCSLVSKAKKPKQLWGLKIPTAPIPLWWESWHDSILESPSLFQMSVICFRCLIVCFLRKVYSLREDGWSIGKPYSLPTTIIALVARLVIEVSYGRALPTRYLALRILLDLDTVRSLSACGFDICGVCCWTSIWLYCVRRAKRLARRGNRLISSGTPPLAKRVRCRN